MCSFDRVNQVTLTCGNVAEVQIVQNSKGGVALFGNDPADETGTLRAYLHEGYVGKVLFEAESTLGQESGFVALLSSTYMLIMYSI